MAKLRGKQKWKHCLTVQGELWALERELDSMSQKGIDVSRQLGRVRSIILRTHTDDQKTLKRWIKPAPNHLEYVKLERSLRVSPQTPLQKIGICYYALAGKD